MFKNNQKQASAVSIIQVMTKNVRFVKMVCNQKISALYPHP